MDLFENQLLHAFLEFSECSPHEASEISFIENEFDAVRLGTPLGKLRGFWASFPTIIWEMWPPWNSITSTLTFFMSETR